MSRKAIAFILLCCVIVVLIVLQEIQVFKVDLFRVSSIFLNNFTAEKKDNRNYYWANKSSLIHFETYPFSTVVVNARSNFSNNQKSNNQTASDYRNESLNLALTIPFSTVVVNARGNFSQRIHLFNEALHQLRLDEWKERGDKEWKEIIVPLKLVWFARDTFLEELSNFTNVKTVMLPFLNTTTPNWNSLTDSWNVLIQEYYEWTADDPICTWIETPGVTKMKYDSTYNRTCQRNMSFSMTPIGLKPLYFNAKPINPWYWPNNGNSFPKHFYMHPPPYVIYVQVVRDGIVNGLGDVFSRNLKIVPFGCSTDTSLTPPQNIPQIPTYDEVVPLAAHWATANFHRIVEIIPRIASILEFLKRNPQIKFVASEGPGGRLGELMKILGLDESRIVTGNAKAKIIYMPRVQGCGFSTVQDSQIISEQYRKYIKNNFPKEPRNKLVLIRRSGSRRFTEQTKIEQVLLSVAKDYNLTFTMFIDNPVPSLNETMQLFNSAVMVVGPHGAGLTNVFFSEPGTYVIEGVCNLSHVNFCFQRLAHILGHHWHGVPSRGGCEGVVDVAVDSIYLAARKYLNMRH